MQNTLRTRGAFDFVERRTVENDMDVAVLGAGLMGVCTAIELAGRGVDVDLYDRADVCISGASLNGEGKVHLGYLYAADPSLRTAKRMVDGALSFSPLMRRWLGGAFDRVPASRPFYYPVHRDSLVPADLFERHLHRVAGLYADACGLARPDYFGRDPRLPPVRVRDLSSIGLSGKLISAVFATEEVAIDSDALAVEVRARVAAEPRIRPHLGTEVLRVSRDRSGLTVHARNGAGPLRKRYDHVINALWDGRLAIDAEMGMTPNRRWLFRYKESLHLRSDATTHIPSVTIALGPFGDIVAYDKGKLYLTWYPAGRHASVDAILPPSEKDILATRNAVRVQTQTLTALAEIVPGVAALPAEVIAAGCLRGGWIFAWGDTDVDDPASELHQRFAVGPASVEGYHTVDTGRFMLAPLFAMQVADALAARS